MTAPHSHARRCLLASCALALPLLAPAQAPRQLTAADAGATVLGPGRYAYMGTDVVAARLDADGMADLVIDAKWSTTATSGRGRVEILRGRRAWPDRADLALTAADASIVADPDTWLGLAGVGDIDGDGLDDVAAFVAGPSTASALVAWRGAGLAGVVSPASARVTIVGTPDLAIHGGLVADLDGDGIDDLLVRATDVPLGRDALLAFRGGAALPARIDLATDAPFTRIDAPVTRNRGPAGAWAAGDVTGDGRTDIVMGSGGWWTESPETSVVVTGVAAWPPRVDALTAPNRILFGARRWQHAVTGDVTGDGVGDLIVSNDTYREQALCVLPGPVQASAPRLTILPRVAGEPSFPLGVADADGDGQADLILGSWSGGPHGRQPGTGDVEIVRGPLPAAGSLSLAADPPALTLFGAPQEAFIAAAVGDFDGDSRPDVAGGAYGAHGSAPDAEIAGAARLFLGAFDAGRPVESLVLRVDAAAGSDAADGLTWDTALATLGEALRRADASAGHADVLVAAGTYRERLLLGWDTTISGGWRPRTDDRNPSVARTTLDGELRGSVIEVTGLDDSPPTRIDGFVITRGRADYGAGARIHGGEAVFVNDELTGNVGARAWIAYPCGTDEHGCPVMSRPYVGETGVGVSVYAEGTSRVALVNDLIHHELLQDPGPEPPWSGSYTLDCSGYYVPPSELSGTAVYVTAVAALEMRNTTVADCVAGVALEGDYGVSRVIRHGIFASLAGPSIRGVDWATVDTNLFDAAIDGATLPPANVIGDPGFVDHARYELRQAASGQSGTSGAVDGALVASADACLLPSPCLDTFSTRTDGEPDASKLDLGFHRFGNEPPVFGGALRATASGSCAVTIAWDAASDPEGRAVAYDVYRADASGAPPVLAGSVAAPARSFTDAGLPWGTRWTWLVRARDPGGRTDSNAAEVSATVGDDAPPLARMVAASSDGGCGVSVAFDASDDCSGLARLELHRSQDPSFAPSAATLLAVDVTSPMLDAFPQNGRYAYRVVARDRAGLAATSAAAVAWVGSCAGAVPPPAEAMIPRVEREATGLRIEIVPAAGADFHRILEGDVRALHAGYTHVASADGAGTCRFDGTRASLPMAPGDRYYLARGVNAAGEGLMGADSFGGPHPDPSAPCP